MKRWIIWLLILLFALSGCNTQKPGNTTMATDPVDTTQQQPSTPPVSLYVSNSALEKKTGGAVQVYAVEGGEITGIDSLDNDLVVFAFDGEKTTITRFSAQDGMVKAASQRSGRISTADGSAAAGDNKLAYFDSEQNSIVFLDGTFHEVDRVTMPEDLTGTPLLSADLKTAYYCTGNEIRAMDMTTGIPRLVCQLNVQQMRIIDLLFDDTILHCYITDTDGNSYASFHSAQTGENLGRDADLKNIASWNGNYLVRRTDGPVEEVLLGGEDGSLHSLSLTGALCVLPESNAVMEISSTETGAALAVFELSQGNALGTVALHGVSGVAMPEEDPNGTFIWFAAEDSDTGNDIICRWEYAAAGSDQNVRIATRYTAENPDVAGLAECEQLAKEISKKYYVNILLGDDPVEPDDYSFVPEYQVSAYKKALQALDTAMARFPEDFFYVIATASKNPKLQINLVREIVPNRYDVPLTDDGLQYWIDECAYMTLVVCDETEQNFYHELCQAMDTYVYAHSSQYDYWTLSNPEGFKYDESYLDYQSHVDSPYLQGEDRAFIDAYSMTYAYEDRATVFEYAMMDGCEEYFQSDIMQEKLTLLCKGIRRAFGWRYYEGTFPWEQYLKESQAYVNKK